MAVSWPGIMGQVAGSCITAAAAGVGDEQWRLGDDAEKTGVTATGITGWRTGDAVWWAGEWWMDDTFMWAGDTWCSWAGDDVWESNITDLWCADTSVTHNSLSILVVASFLDNFYLSSMNHLMQFCQQTMVITCDQIITIDLCACTILPILCYHSCRWQSRE